MKHMARMFHVRHCFRSPGQSGEFMYRSEGQKVDSHASSTLEVSVFNGGKHVEKFYGCR